MIHKPMTWVSGNADEIRKEADVLDGCQKVILSTYMEHVKDGVTEKKINDLINAETWLNGEECQEYFNFDVEDSNEAVAAVSEYFDKYNNLPEKLKELTGGNTEKSSGKPEADDNKWQKNLSAWCEKTAKQLSDITEKLDKHELGERSEKKEHDGRIAAILNEIEYL